MIAVHLNDGFGLALFLLDSFLFQIFRFAQRLDQLFECYSARARLLLFGTAHKSTLQISQRAAPLDLTLDKYGSQTPSDANRFSLAVGTGALGKIDNLQDQFAPAQFQNMDDADKLSSAAFVPLDSGIELAAAGKAYATGNALTRIVRYDVTIIDKNLLRLTSRFFNFAGSLFQHLLLGSSVARSPLSAYQKSLAQPYAPKVTVQPETFAVAFAANNRVYRAEAANFSSQAAANDYLARAVSTDPSLAGTLHVLPQFELALAA